MLLQNCKPFEKIYPDSLWEQIKQERETLGTSFDKLGDKYGLAGTTIFRHAAKYGWESPPPPEKPFTQQKAHETLQALRNAQPSKSATPLTLLPPFQPGLPSANPYGSDGGKKARNLAKKFAPDAILRAYQMCCSTYPSVAIRGIEVILKYAISPAGPDDVDKPKIPALDFARMSPEELAEAETMFKSLSRLQAAERERLDDEERLAELSQPDAQPSADPQESGLSEDVTDAEIVVDEAEDFDADGEGMDVPDREPETPGQEVIAPGEYAPEPDPGPRIDDFDPNEW